MAEAEIAAGLQDKKIGRGERTRGELLALLHIGLRLQLLMHNIGSYNLVNPVDMLCSQNLMAIV